MSEIRIVTSSDEHISDLTPGFRKDNYKDTILEKLDWQGRFARRFGAHALIRGGDFFHVKAANKTTMGLMAHVASIHRSYPCPVYSIVGNHDMTRNDVTTVETQPIGVLFSSFVFSRIVKESFLAGSLHVRVVGVDYDPRMDVDFLRETLRDDVDADYRIAVIHALAENSPSERLQSFFNEQILDYRDLVFDGCPDAYVFGHYHKDQGIQDHLGVKFVNLGAVSRGSLNVDNIERKPKVASFTFNSQGMSVEEHVVPHLDASEVFNFDLKKQMEKERRSIAEFLHRLQENVSMSSGGDIEAKLKEMNASPKFPADLRKMVGLILETAESGGDLKDFDGI